MAILVTRPEPDNQATAHALRARGFEVLLAPMLMSQSMAFHDTPGARTTGIVITSANAARAVAAHAMRAQWHGLPVFAVGEHTAQAARDAGFRNVKSADGDAVALRKLIVATVALPRKKAMDISLLYLSAADTSRDLAAELNDDGIPTRTLTVYRMLPACGLPSDIVDAFAGQAIAAVLHYSRRGAQAFVDVVRASALEISALALPQCCLSDAVARTLRDAGAARVAVASQPHEDALFATLERLLPPRR